MIGDAAAPWWPHLRHRCADNSTPGETIIASLLDKSFTERADRVCRLQSASTLPLTTCQQGDKHRSVSRAGLQLLGVSAREDRGPARVNVVAGQMRISPSSRPREHSVACYRTGLSGRSLAQTAVFESSGHMGEPCLRLLYVVSSAMRRVRVARHPDRRSLCLVGPALCRG